MAPASSSTEIARYKARGFANRMGFGEKCAVLVIDLSNGFTDPSLPLGAPSEETVKHVNHLLDAAHSASVPVYFSTISYESPALTDAGVWQLKMDGLATLRADSPAVAIDGRLHREPHDIVFAKRYASCFFGTDLASRLAAQGIDTLIITGCSTSGCVRATAVDACQSGFKTIVVREAVGDRSLIAHDQSLVDIEAKYGDVISITDALTYLERQAVPTELQDPEAAPGDTMHGSSQAGKAVLVEQVRDVMRRQTSTVAILTARSGEERAGIIVSSVISVSLDPPSVLISVNRTASIYPLLRNSGRFAVNWLSDSHASLVPIFSWKLKGESRFDFGDWEETGGIPTLASARAAFHCRVDADFAYGSHHVFIGKIERVFAGTWPAALLWHEGKAVAAPSIACRSFTPSSPGRPRMQFGIFLPNGSNGYILSKASPTYLPTYDHLLEITKESERFGLDFVISMIKFRGFGGPTGFWDGCLESFTLSAALAAETERIRIFASAGIPSLHPALTARMIATLDSISKGRCGLNVVTGWNRPEYDQMGLWPSATYHNDRYEFAAEYIEIVKELWDHGRTTRKTGSFDLEDCQCYPQPQHPIQVVSAGQSPKGAEFTAQYADYNFVFAPSERLKKMTADLKAKAAKHNRNVGTLACFTLIAAETDEEAEAYTQRIIDEADVTAIENMVASARIDTNQGGSSENLRAALSQSAEAGNMAYMSIPVISGSYETCARKIDAIAAESGIAGMLWSFPDFVKGVRDFGTRIMPQLSCLNRTRQSEPA